METRRAIPRLPRTWFNRELLSLPEIEPPANEDQAIDVDGPESSTQASQPQTPSAPVEDDKIDRQHEERDRVHKFVQQKLKAIHDSYAPRSPPTYQAGDVVKVLALGKGNGKIDPTYIGPLKVVASTDANNVWIQTPPFTKGARRAQKNKIYSGHIARYHPDAATARFLDVKRYVLRRWNKQGVPFLLAELEKTPQCQWVEETNKHHALLLRQEQSLGVIPETGIPRTRTSAHSSDAVRKQKERWGLKHPILRNSYPDEFPHMDASLSESAPAPTNIETTIAVPSAVFNITVRGVHHRAVSLRTMNDGHYWLQCESGATYSSKEVDTVNLLPLRAYHPPHCTVIEEHPPDWWNLKNLEAIRLETLHRLSQGPRPTADPISASDLDQRLSFANSACLVP